MFGREARGRSPAYESLGAAVADDDLILEFLATLPRAKRQPNLLFAAACYLLDAPPDIGTLRTLVQRNGAELSQVMRARRTQTNEPARCATLLPALAALPGPLALIEVGASAGLTIRRSLSNSTVMRGPADLFRRHQRLMPRACLRESLIDVFDNVGAVLDTDRKPDGLRENAGHPLLFR